MRSASDRAAFEATLDPKNPQVMALRSAVERGDADECSFAFRVTQQKCDEDYTRRWIQAVDIDGGDVSVVSFGANVHTKGLVGVRSAKYRQRASGDYDARGALNAALARAGHLAAAMIGSALAQIQK